MISENKKRASRENGARSRGPVTPEGKRAAARNATTHGLLSKTIVLDGESAGRFSNLIAALLAEFQPRTELALVENMAVCRWRQIRLWGMEKAGITNEIRKQAESHAVSSADSKAALDPPTRTVLAFTAMNEGRTLDLINRYETRFDRQYSRALRTLMQLRAHRQDVMVDPPSPRREDIGPARE